MDQAPLVLLRHRVSVPAAQEATGSHGAPKPESEISRWAAATATHLRSTMTARSLAAAQRLATPNGMPSRGLPQRPLRTSARLAGRSAAPTSSHTHRSDAAEYPNAPNGRCQISFSHQLSRNLKNRAILRITHLKVNVFPLAQRQCPNSSRRRTNGRAHLNHHRSDSAQPRMAYALRRSLSERGSSPGAMGEMPMPRIKLVARASRPWLAKRAPAEQSPKPKAASLRTSVAWTSCP